MTTCIVTVCFLFVLFKNEKECTPFAVHYEKIRIHLRETATDSTEILSLTRKNEHLRINQAFVACETPLVGFPGLWPHSCYPYLVEFPDARCRPSLVVGVFAVVAVLIVVCCSCCSMCSCCSSILAT